MHLKGLPETKKQGVDRHGEALMKTQKNKIGYTMTDTPSVVTEVTVINLVNIGSDHRMVMSSITINTERRKQLNKNTQTRVDTKMIGTQITRSNST